LKHKRLVIIRHAHRDKDRGRQFDNGISAKGKKQVSRLIRYFARIYSEAHPLVLSSPKLRCLETVAPLAELCGTKVVKDPRLLEQQELKKESEKDLDSRAREFSASWPDSEPDLTIACSHGDWIPLCLKHLTGADLDLKKGGWAEIALIDGKPRLVQLIQGFKRLLPE
jgi:broad specificity phosphatase PhoE